MFVCMLMKWEVKFVICENLNDFENFMVEIGCVIFYIGRIIFIFRFFL